MTSRPGPDPKEALFPRDLEDQKKERLPNKLDAKIVRVRAVLPTVVFLSVVALTVQYIRINSTIKKVGIPAIELTAVMKASNLPGLIPLGYQCTPEEATYQAKDFNPGKFRTNCPSRKFWSSIYSAGFTCRDLVMVDVGANKGYLLATWIDLVRPSLGISPRSLYTQYINKTDFPVLKKMACGACGDCRDPPMSSTASKYCIEEDAIIHASKFKLTLHGVEPDPLNIKILELGLVTMLDLAKEHEDKDGKGEVVLKLHQMAASGDNSTKFVEFSICPPGHEVCGIETKASEKTMSVPATTLDLWADAQGIGMIDVLVTDTEGMDALVLRGANDLLAQRRVRVINFEYHELRAWKTERLEDTVSFLDKYGYDCFLIGADGALRLTGCWQPEFEFKKWSNVMCVDRREVAMLAAVEGFTPLIRLSHF